MTESNKVWVFHQTMKHFLLLHSPCRSYLIISDSEPVCPFGHQKRWLSGHPKGFSNLQPCSLCSCVCFLFSLKTWEDLEKDSVLFCCSTKSVFWPKAFFLLHLILSLDSKPKQFLSWKLYWTICLIFFSVLVCVIHWTEGYFNRTDFSAAFIEWKMFIFL